MSRGGFRANSGRKKKSDQQKILEGKLDANVLKARTVEGESVDVEVIDSDLPPLRDYMTKQQKNGTYLQAEEEYKRVLEWIKKSGCEDKVPKNLIEQYVMNRCRYIELQNSVSEYGYVVKKGSNGNIQPNPFFQMLQEQERTLNVSYNNIDNIIRQRSISSLYYENDDTGKKMMSIMNIGGM